MNKAFNVRVYGIWIHDGRLLVNDELIRGRSVIKLPGGGLDWGEGTIDCLKREWKEELDLDIEVHDHFYTTDFFQYSAYGDAQVISIYYYVSALPQAEINNLVEGERSCWMELSMVNADTFTLPIDKVVGAKLAALHSGGSI
jgi:ADP-ribose pyrophosphatase YjhB (NUDIX family)